MATVVNQKALGAFYTAESVAAFLVDWSVRKGTDKVLDPSCGSGVFLAAALRRLKNLKNGSGEVFGVDFDPEAVSSARKKCPSSRIVLSDFFGVKAGDFQQFDAVVGNPPFIRYQTFSGSMRTAALKCAQMSGVRLPQLASSWAPFLIHAMSFLRSGGRLAMVVPAELGHAQYAQEVLRFLTRRFGKVKICMFRKKLFPELSEDTFLLLADEYGSPCRWLSVAPFEDIHSANFDAKNEIPVDVGSIGTARIRLMHYLLPCRARQLYISLSQEKGVIRLGNAADVGIGYVTGCNGFFHLSDAERISWRIPRGFLKPAVFSLKEHFGLVFRQEDWNLLRQAGRKVYLFTVPCVSETNLPTQVRNYVSRGKRIGVSRRFKCRVRDPWYSVPHIRVADAFLSYMSGGFPRLVLNPRGFVAPNTLHLAQFVNDFDKRQAVVGWHSSLSVLSCEMEGHALGGGMLKLEPTEAGRLLIALPRPSDIRSLIVEIDRRLRAGNQNAARDLVDNQVLRRRFGLSATECAVLRDAASNLEAWRMHK